MACGTPHLSTLFCRAPGLPAVQGRGSSLDILGTWRRRYRALRSQREPLSSGPETGKRARMPSSSVLCADLWKSLWIDALRSCQIRVAPFCQLKENGEQSLPLLRKGIFDVRRDLVELLPMDDLELLQIPEGSGQHRIRDARDRSFQLSKTTSWMLAKLIDDMCAPFPAQQFQCLSHRAIVTHFIGQYLLQILFCCHIFFHDAAPSISIRTMYG